MFALFNEKAPIPTPIVNLTRPTVAVLWKTSRCGARLPLPERHAADTLHRTKWDYSAEREDKGSLCWVQLPQTGADTERKIPHPPNVCKAGREVVGEKKNTHLFGTLVVYIWNSVSSIWRFSRGKISMRWWHTTLFFSFLFTWIGNFTIAVLLPEWVELSIKAAANHVFINWMSIFNNVKLWTKPIVFYYWNLFFFKLHFKVTQGDNLEVSSASLVGGIITRSNVNEMLINDLGSNLSICSHLCVKTRPIESWETPLATARQPSHWHVVWFYL